MIIFMFKVKYFILMIKEKNNLIAMAYNKKISNIKKNERFISNKQNFGLYFGPIWNHNLV